MLGKEKGTRWKPDPFFLLSAGFELFELHQDYIQPDETNFGIKKTQNNPRKRGNLYLKFLNFAKNRKNMILNFETI